MLPLTRYLLLCEPTGRDWLTLTYQYQMFVAFETAREVGKHLARQYGTQFAIGTGAWGLYVNTIKHPNHAKDVSFAEGLKSNPNVSPELRNFLYNHLCV